MRRLSREAWKKIRFPWWSWIIIGVFGLSGLFYGVDIAITAGTLPRGVSVGGVSVGGLSQQDASRKLQEELGSSVDQPVHIRAGELSSMLVPAQAGLSVDWDATVEQAGRQSWNPIVRIRSFFSDRDVGIVSRVSHDMFDKEANRVAQELTRDAMNATLTPTSDGHFVVTPDMPGQKIDPDHVRSRVEHTWLNTDHTVTLDTQVDYAAVRTDAADKAVRDVVTPATSSALVFHGRNGVNATIGSSELSQILSFVPDGNSLAPRWNNDAARQVLEKQLSSTEIKFRNAGFIRNASGSFTVVPHQDGVEINWQETLGDIGPKALNTALRDYTVTYEEKKATYTTDQARQARFDETVGEFTTGGFSVASGVNIRRVAEIVNGALVLPGETFSLNNYTGPRGRKEGFVESGIIINGHAGTAVGGGISQFATTLFNAAYFAGMDDVSHRPHSYYISRYPAGREATVFEGQIDLKFKNPFNTPVMIVTQADSRQVTVKLLGVKHVTVESIAGERTNPTQPKRIELHGDKCSASSGAPGFTITDTRIVRNLDGTLREKKTRRTVYDPAPIVHCRP